MNISGSKVYDWGGISNDSVENELVKSGVVILLSDILAALNKTFANLPHTRRYPDETDLNIVGSMGKWFLTLETVKEDFFKKHDTKGRK